jgi:hypothetical protein
MQHQALVWWRLSVLPLRIILVTSLAATALMSGSSRGPASQLVFAGSYAR